MSLHSPTVTLFSRPGCHLCEAAAELLGRLAREYAFTLEEQDISVDPALEKRYLLSIPVIRFPNGAELSAPVREADVRRALERVVGGDSHATS